MPLPWVRVPYDIDSADLSTPHLAVSIREPSPDAAEWRPAYRDTVDGQRVVQVRASLGRRDRVWLRDSSGVRRVTPLR